MGTSNKKERNQLKREKLWKLPSYRRNSRPRSNRRKSSQIPIPLLIRAITMRRAISSQTSVLLPKMKLVVVIPHHRKRGRKCSNLHRMKMTTRDLLIRKNNKKPATTTSNPKTKLKSSATKRTILTPKTSIPMKGKHPIRKGKPPTCSKIRMLTLKREIPLLATPRSTFPQTPSRKLLRFFIVASVIYESRKKF